MPGWYIHMDAGMQAAKRLSAGDLPPEYGLDPAEAARLGELAHTWRNYLAIGTVAPDLFYFLPDFNAPNDWLMGVADWLLQVWDVLDAEIVGPWETYMGPVGANNADLAAQLSGGLSTQIGQAVDELVAAAVNVFETAALRSADVFSILTSGPPQGFPETAFYWSDMLHYRCTYDVPRVLYENARAAELAANDRTARLDAQTIQAFALGWMSHCATDVVGHPLTNAKCGGPFRLHWQRHHLVENHFDTLAYNDQHGGQAFYGTIGTSALHFRLAFRRRDDRPVYQGRPDAPAYDYFVDFPPYDLGHSAQADFLRATHFDMDAGELSDHLVTAISDALTEVYETNDPARNITPRVLSSNASQAPYNDNGRPNGEALGLMWRIANIFLRRIHSSGFGVEPPDPPSIIGDHPFPLPPGAGPPEDPSRGADLDDDTFTFIDLLLALIAWAIWLLQVVVWLVTVLPSLVADLVTYPVREILYGVVVAPLYGLFMETRRMLVETGFLTPEPVEIDPGLVELGRGSLYWREQLRRDLDEPSGFAPLHAGADEPSGRTDASEEWDADPAYPRDTPRDPMPQIDGMLAALGLPPYQGWRPPEQDPYSEWIAPWLYPDHDLQGHRVGWEASLTHVGPFLTGDDARILLARKDTDTALAANFETAPNPEETENISHTHLPNGRDLGLPIDYTLYLIGQLTSGRKVPSFNLDSDRGYAWRCWDWNRHQPSPQQRWDCYPKWNQFPPATNPFATQQPCTPPAQFDGYSVKPDQPDYPATVKPEHRFDPTHRLLGHYLDGNPVNYPTCDDKVNLDIDAKILDVDRERNEIPPEGEG